jgi:hypothetical protein
MVGPNETVVAKCVTPPAAAAAGAPAPATPASTAATTARLAHLAVLNFLPFMTSPPFFRGLSRTRLGPVPRGELQAVVKQMQIRCT